MGNKAYVICRKGKKTKKKRLSTITKGLQSLIKSSEVLNLEQFYNNLKNSETSNETVVYIHSTCRNIQNAVRMKERAAKGDHKTDTSTEPKSPTRRFCGKSDWQVRCFICGNKCQNQETYQRCETLSTHSTILKMCDNREDAEGLAVKRRIMSCSDLLAVGAYHTKCQNTFDLDSKSAKSIISLDKKNISKHRATLKF